MVVRCHFAAIAAACTADVAGAIATPVLDHALKARSRRALGSWTSALQGKEVQPDGGSPGNPRQYFTDLDPSENGSQTHGVTSINSLSGSAKQHYGSGVGTHRREPGQPNVDMEVPPPSQLNVCAAWAICGGLLTSLGYNVVAYATRGCGQAGGEPNKSTNNMMLVLNVLLSLSGVLCFVVASKHGPVAVAMPVLTATTLLSNMALQASMGIAYSKPMRVGTFVLATASMCLMDVGPTDPESPMDVMVLLSKSVARVWLALLVALLVACAAIMRKIDEDSPYLRMSILAILVADSTALGASVGKMLTATYGSLFMACLAVYFCLGVTTLVGGANAAASCDMSVYLPTSQCVQLLLNAATGLLVWGDGPRVQAWVSYTMVYLLICQGVYLCSSVDFVAMYAKRRGLLAKFMHSYFHMGDVEKREGMLAHDSVESRISAALQPLETLSQGGPPIASNEECAAQLMESALRKGIEDGSLDPESVAALCGRLYGFALKEAARSSEDGVVNKLVVEWEHSRLLSLGLLESS